MIYVPLHQPYTDFGFKKLFGEEANKDLLIDFLNTLLPEKHLIKDFVPQSGSPWHNTDGIRQLDGA